ncbi:hypothetical protein F5Y16DRAFT_423720 [Xylariaceae sp. FL0255]|nr:hypothetical protein F5Y16DRAFT_423720 [Xylariaceae sp. FL0255]
MASPRDVARENWENAQKVRSEILAKLSNLKKERNNFNYTTRFEEVDGIMAEYGLLSHASCLIFHDFEYAAMKKVEHSLWQVHTSVSGEYRKTLSRLVTQSQVVQKRKLDKLYRAFLKTSEQFYSVYIQQLSARFSIPELRLIAFGPEKQSAGEANADIAAPAPLRALILASCQTTLVHMGDLARYRCQMSDKVSKSTFDKALDYYTLAHALDPEDGSAHHQSGVLCQLLGQHFDIVYHFHRAIAVSKPHQLALGNLEIEFKNPETSSQTRKGPSKDPSEAMVTWFVRLQAFFFHGKQFSQHTELEEEVLHRVEIALKSDGEDTLLLKMILTNMAAYSIATQKVKSSWTMEGSQSCQYLLRFNVRMILTLVRALDKALRDKIVPMPDQIETPSDGDSSISFAPSVLKLLPLFRLHLAWVYITRNDIVQYQEYLEPHINELYRLLASVLTYLNLYTDSTIDTVSSQYLLSEDSEALGLQPLSDRKLPLFFYMEDKKGTNPPKRNKILKPQQKIYGRQFKQGTETVWRIRDIICSGVFLAGSAKFPLALTLQNYSGRETEMWTFTDEATPSISVDEAVLSRLLKKLGFSDFKRDTKNTPEKENLDVSPAEILNGRVPATKEKKKENTFKSAVAPAQDLPVKQPSLAQQDSFFDSEMINMVDKLLDPQENERPQSSEAQAEPSYGMHSTTANEIFGRLATSPAQPSPVSKTIPSLPWGYFYTPTPHRSNSQEQNMLSDNFHIPRTAEAQFKDVNSSPYLNTLNTPFDQTRTTPLPPPPNSGYVQDRTSQSASSSTTVSKNRGMNSLEDSRSAVLDSLASALRAQHGMARNDSTGTSHSNHMSMSPTWGQQTTNGGDLAYPSAAHSGQASESTRRDNNSRPGINQRTSVWPAELGRSGTTQAAFYGNNSHLPSTMSSTSNGFDVKHLWAQDSSVYQQQPSRSPWQYEPSSAASSLAFSNTSSLLAGTPRAVPAPANTVACNGNYYNASTPFGRLGSGVNNRDDPTHFRNQLKAVTGSSEMPYDQQILQGALMDDNYKPRGK